VFPWCLTLLSPFCCIFSRQPFLIALLLFQSARLAADPLCSKAQLGTHYSLKWLEDDLIDPALLRRLKQSKQTRPAETVARLLNPPPENLATNGTEPSSSVPPLKDAAKVTDLPRDEIEGEIHALQHMLRSCTGVNDRTRKRLRECTQIAIWQQHLFAEERRHWYEADRQFRRRNERNAGGGTSKRKGGSQQVRAREIVAKRTVDGHVHYMVSWAEAIPNSWHHVDDLKCIQLIESFEASQSEKQREPLQSGSSPRNELDQKRDKRGGKRGEVEPAESNLDHPGGERKKQKPASPVSQNAVMEQDAATALTEKVAMHLRGVEGPDLKAFIEELECMEKISRDMPSNGRSNGIDRIVCDTDSDNGGDTVSDMGDTDDDVDV